MPYVAPWATMPLSLLKDESFSRDDLIAYAIVNYLSGKGDGVPMTVVSSDFEDSLNRLIAAGYLSLDDGCLYVEEVLVYED